MVNAVYDHIFAIIIVGMIFVGAVVALPAMSLINIEAVDQQQLRNIALNVFNALLLDTGEPANWGSFLDFQMNDPRIKRFGLASAEDSALYVLDPDKVQRLVVGNPLNYCDYNKVRELLKLQDYGFRLRIIPPFNVSFLSQSVDNNILNYRARVSYLDGRPIPNAKCNATVVYTKDQKYFYINQSGPVETDAMGICEDNIQLKVQPDYYTIVLRVTVADVATLVVISGQTIKNTIARINIVYDTIILSSWKDPPNYNAEPGESPEDVWIFDIVAFGSDGSMRKLFEDHTRGTGNKFNSGRGPFIRWYQDFPGLHDFEPVVLIFNFWAEPENSTKPGRQQVLISMAYPDILGTSIFNYGGIPESSESSVTIQRSVIISGMTYIAELTLWKESHGI